MTPDRIILSIIAALLMVAALAHCVISVREWNRRRPVLFWVPGERIKASSSADTKAHGFGSAQGVASGSDRGHAHTLFHDLERVAERRTTQAQRIIDACERGELFCEHCPVVGKCSVCGEEHLESGWSG